MESEKREGSGWMGRGEGPGMSYIPKEGEEGPAGGPPALLKSGNSPWDQPGSVDPQGIESSFLEL